MFHFQKMPSLYESGLETWLAGENVATLAGILSVTPQLNRGKKWKQESKNESRITAAAGCRDPEASRG